MNDKLYGTIISIMIIWIFWTTSHLFGLFNDVIKDIESWDGYEVADVTITLFGFVLTLALWLLFISKLESKYINKIILKNLSRHDFY